MAGEREIRVEAYSGYRGQERPACFWPGEKPVAVKRILRRWHEEGAEVGGERRSCFEVEGEDGRAYRLCYHQKEGAWFLMEIP
jgi:hypothetical protein